MVDALCHNCRLTDGMFIYMMWECSKIRPLWLKVTEFILDNFHLPIVCNPEVCLLDVIENDEVNNTTKKFLRLLVFYCMYENYTGYVLSF